MREFRIRVWGFGLRGKSADPDIQSQCFTRVFDLHSSALEKEMDRLSTCGLKPLTLLEGSWDVVANYTKHLIWMRDG